MYAWPPDTHTEAPTGGSVVLAIIMLKLSAYGFLRFSLLTAPDASHSPSVFIIAISLITVTHIGLAALVQADIKKLVVYSPITYTGFVTLGPFVFSEIDVEDDIVQMIPHGSTSGAAFLCIGVLYGYMHSRQIADYDGVVNIVPKFAALPAFFAIANCGLLATSGFVDELTVILGPVKLNFWIDLLVATALIFGAAHSFWTVERVAFDDVTHKHVAELKDLNCRGLFMLGVLAIVAPYTGPYPEPFTDIIHASVVDLLTHVVQSKL